MVAINVVLLLLSAEEEVPSREPVYADAEPLVSPAAHQGGRDVTRGSCVALTEGK